MKSVRTQAIVLRRTNYGEADKVLQVLTPGHGKMSVIAKGVRREKSKLAGGVELFTRTDITVSSGKGELGILTGARAQVVYLHILKDYDRMSFGYEALKQVAKASDTMDEPAFFDLLDQTFESLNDDSISLSIIRAWFWLQLAILQGNGLNLATDGSGMKLQADKTYNFDVEQEVFVPASKGSTTSDHIKVLRLLSAQSPRVVTHVEGIDSLLDGCLWIAERAVGH